MWLQMCQCSRKPAICLSLGRTDQHLSRNAKSGMQAPKHSDEKATLAVRNFRDTRTYLFGKKGSGTIAATPLRHIVELSA